MIDIKIDLNQTMRLFAKMESIQNSLRKEFMKKKEYYEGVIKNKSKVISLNELLGIESLENKNIEKQPTQFSTQNAEEMMKLIEKYSDKLNKIPQIKKETHISFDDKPLDSENIYTEKKLHNRKKLSEIPDKLIKTMKTNWEPVKTIKDEREYNLYKLSKVEIKFDEKKRKNTYNIIEPHLDDKEKEELDMINRSFQYIFEKITYKSGDSTERAEEIIREAAKDILQRLNIKYDNEKFEKYFYYLARNYLGLGMIEPMIHDKFVEDISCDGVGINIYLNHMEYGGIEVNRSFLNKDDLNNFIVKLAQKCRKEISISKPILQGSLEDGSRVEAVYGEDVTSKGSTFTIRKFREEPYTPIHLIDNQTINSFVMAYLWLSVENKKSVLISGGTATGKTTFLNALSLFVPTDDKIVSIEDTPEINLPHEHWVPMISRETNTQNEITMFDLLKASLRERPDFIIVGEIRGEEANVLFQGIATGHSGLGTVHANKFEDLVNRMTIRPINLPKRLLVELDLVIFLKRVNIGGKSQRKVSDIVELGNYDFENDEIRTNSFTNLNPSTGELEVSHKSYVVSKLLELKGGHEEDIWTEFEKRKRILETMHHKGIMEFNQVTKIFREYYRNPFGIFEYIENFTIDNQNE